MKATIRPTLAALLVLIALSTSFAQQKRQAPVKPQSKPVAAPTPLPTFDTLLPAESYAIYWEVRGVGQLIRSNTASDVLEPILKIGGPPKGFETFVKWLKAHADELMTSRLLFVMGPTKALPDILIAVEFATEEEAAKIAPSMNEALVQLLGGTSKETARSGEPPPADKQGTTVKPDLYLERVGSLILLTSQPLKLSQLRPAGSKLLFEDNNFRTARNRFNSEPVFVYLDFKTMERRDEERRKEYEAANRAALEQARKEAAATEESKQTVNAPNFEVEETKKDIAGEFRIEPPPPPQPEKEPPAPDPVATAISMAASSFFNVQSDAPDAVGIAVSFENDSFDARALLINQPGEKSDAVPFLPMLIPGPNILSESPNILPADTELFVTMSLDLPQIYATLSRPRPNQFAYTSRGNLQTVDETVFQPPFAEIEKLLKISVRDDLLPLLGSEVAVGLPLTGLGGLRLPGVPISIAEPEQKPTDQETTRKSGLVILVSLKDKEGMRALLPKLVESFGFKGASLFAQTERQDDTELVSYANLFAYAFIGNFLVLSNDAATTRHVVASYLKRETLAGDTNFRSYTRWQPRPSHGQLYISPALMESFKGWVEQPTTRLSDQTRALLTRLAAVAQPITYSLWNEGFGPLHELHIPKNLVLMAVTGISSEANPPPELSNERTAMGLLYQIAYSQEQYKRTKGNGNYGTLEQLLAEGIVSKEMIEKSGYRIDMTVSGDKFEVSAVPLEYGTTGAMSYFIDETKILRGADRNGASATSSDPRIN